MVAQCCAAPVIIVCCRADTTQTRTHARILPQSVADILPGEFMLQNVCSLVAAHVLAPTPGSRVLDMCAAPGGKTTALAQLMGNEGEVSGTSVHELSVVLDMCAVWPAK